MYVVRRKVMISEVFSVCPWAGWRGAEGGHLDQELSNEIMSNQHLSRGSGGRRYPKKVILSLNNLWRLNWRLPSQCSVIVFCKRQEPFDMSAWISTCETNLAEIVVLLCLGVIVSLTYSNVAGYTPKRVLVFCRHRR